MGVTQKVRGTHLVENPVGTKEMLVVPMSFETGEQGAVNIPFNFKARIDKVSSIVTKDLADTDAGTITAANSAGSMADGVLTHAASASQGDEQEDEPTTNTTIASGTDLTLTPAKTTAGGKVVVTVHYTRLY